MLCLIPKSYATTRNLVSSTGQDQDFEVVTNLTQSSPAMVGWARTFRRTESTEEVEIPPRMAPFSRMRRTRARVSISEMPAMPWRFR